jgi:hypothetical protein
MRILGIVALGATFGGGESSAADITPHSMLHAAALLIGFALLSILPLFVAELF